MAKGISLHLGVNLLDSDHYNGWEGKLNACERDAKDMQGIASSQGFNTRLLLSRDVTRKSVLDFMDTAAAELMPGDICFISYSGHGGQLPDFNRDEPDGQDETWCLFDGQLLDDELRMQWTKFRQGVRILVTSDSCHSGTIVKSARNSLVHYCQVTARYMDDQNALTVYGYNQAFYDRLLSRVQKVDPSAIEAGILLISGCQDNQYSYDGTFNGAFTGALKRVWNGGTFNQKSSASYLVFHRQILNLLPAYQSPNLMTLGKGTEAFVRQKPFYI